MFEGAAIVRKPDQVNVLHGERLVRGRDAGWEASFKRPAHRQAEQRLTVPKASGVAPPCRIGLNTRVVSVFGGGMRPKQLALLVRCWAAPAEYCPQVGEAAT